MDKKFWTQDEKQRLQQLRLSPAQNLPEKLIPLVGHFRSGGSKYAVTGGSGPVEVSKGLASKVEELVGDGSLDWLAEAYLPHEAAYIMREDDPSTTPDNSNSTALDDPPSGEDMAAHLPEGDEIFPGVGPSNRLPARDTELSSSPGGPDPEEEIGPGIGECTTPVPWPDVTQLESWGITGTNAADYLKAWRETHEKGWHGVCGWYVELVANLQEGIPLSEAYDITYAHWLGERWSCQFLVDIANLMKLYHPWKGGANRRAFMDEARKVLCSTPTDQDTDLTEVSREQTVDLLSATAHEAYQLVHYCGAILQRYSTWNLNLRRPDPGPPLGLTPQGSRPKLSEGPVYQQPPTMT